MRFTGKLSFEHRANKNRTSESDTTDKFNIIMLLYEKFSLIGLTGEMIPIPDGGPDRYRLPDITIPQKNIVIELDGAIHGFGDKISKKKRDVYRDEDYKTAGYKLIIVNKETTKGYRKDLVETVFLENGLRYN